MPKSKKSEPTEVEVKSEEPSEKVEIKQGVVDVPRKKTGFLRIQGRAGKFLGVMFDNEGYSTEVVPDHVREQLIKDYPGAVIEEL